MQQSYDTLVEKWSPVLNEESAGKIQDNHRRSVTAAVLENQERAMTEQRAEMGSFLSENAASPANNTGSVSNFDPVLISLVRRAMPNLIAYDIAGVQPMNGPTGLIFAMKARYGGGATTNREALFGEAETQFSGDSSGTHDSDNASGWNGVDSEGARLTALSATGSPTVDAEAMGSTGGSDFHEMGFTIEKSTVTAVSRALKAEYTIELAQDLKAIHGLDAETELANILSTEILAEINREVIRTVNSQAKTGAQQSNVTANGVFNMSSDTDGRWSAEKFKGLAVQIDRECNVIAKETRRGKGNVLICSSDVATALAAAGTLDYSPAIANNLQVDDTGNTFAGLLNGRIKVYIDPYANVDYCTVGYKGTNPYDAGVFYCPYVPLQMVKAIGEDNFQPRIGFKTRYGMASNPFVGSTPANGLATAKTNPYYRIFKIINILT
tara:strand:- start:417 stop:1733 length:1317 start_codon:yes stop_codon:yes gene_type:complete